MTLDESQKRYQGRLKFFDENKNYGFIVDDLDQSDIFVHYDDIQKADIDKEYLKTAKHGNIIRFSFQVMGYVGKYNKSRKAINL
jgi:cold shock CspA family protein